MSDGDNGFSFGSKGAPRGGGKAGADDSGDIDAIEVSGEPVSRTEAKSLGLAAGDSQRMARSPTAVLRKDQLPDGVTPQLSEKLEKAWTHLKRNEIEDALTLAQEAVWEYPSLVAAKLIIARCFINRKEYDKALAILQAIPEADKTPETLYYLGLSQSRLGKIREAIETLKLSRLASNDPVIRKRANDLLMHLQGEQTVCPACGKKTLYDSMVEVGNRSVCTNCAKSEREKLGEEEEELDEEEILNGGKRRKRLRPPLSRTDIMVRLLFILFLVFILYIGLYFMSLLTPGSYASIRSLLPASWTFLPRITQTQIDPSLNNSGPIEIPTMVFESPSIDRAIAGVELRRTLRIEGMEDRDGVYGVIFSPEPKSEYKMDAKSGEFTWTPDPNDAGMTYELAFSAVFKNVKARDQVNNVRVSAGPEFHRVGVWPNANPDAVLHLQSEDVTSDDKRELILYSGEYWRGDISILQENEKGEYQELAHAPVAGRPIGAGAIMAGEEKWLALADYWSSRIRFFAYRGRSLAEMAVTIELPGRPLLADFWREGSVSAVLCRTGEGLRVLAFKQEGQLNSKQIGDWAVPEEYVWRRLLVVHRDRPDSPASVVLIGGDFPNSLFILESGKTVPRQVRNPYPGTLVDAILSHDGKRVRCLSDNEGALKISTVTIQPGVGEEIVETVSAGTAPSLCGLASLDLTGNGSDDFIILGSSKIGFSFGESNAGLSAMTFWPLPAPARLFGQPIAQPSPSGAGSELIYADAGGDLWSVRLAD